MVIFVSQSSLFSLFLTHSTGGFKLYQVYFCCFWPKAHQKQQNRGILKAKTIMFFCIGLDLKQGWFLVDKFLYYLFQENHAGETAAGRGWGSVLLPPLLVGPPHCSPLSLLLRPSAASRVVRSGLGLPPPSLTLSYLCKIYIIINILQASLQRKIPSYINMWEENNENVPFMKS